MISATRKALALAFVVGVATTFAASAAAAPIPAGNTGWYWANPLPQGNAIARADEAGGRVWAAGGAGTLIYSDDEGVTWGGVRTGLLDGIRALDALSANSVVFAGSCALRRTDDGGATVQRLPWSASDSDCASKIVTVSFPDSLVGYLLLENGDVYATSDGGNTWKKQGAAPLSMSVGGTAAVYDMHFTTPQRGVLSVADKVLYTNDAGANWTPVLSAAIGPGTYRFGFAGTEVGYAVGDHSDLIKTIDGGATWNVVGGDGLARAAKLTKISCASAEVCIASTEQQIGILKTADGGDHWSVALSSARSAATLFPGGGGVAFSGFGEITRTTDFGSSWWPYDPTVANPASTISYLQNVRMSGRRSALAFGGQFAVSHDGGNNWHPADPPPERGPTIDAAQTGKHIVAITESRKVFHTSERANLNKSTWKQIKLLPSVKPLGVLVWKGGRTALIGPRGVRMSTKWGAHARLVRGKTAKVSLNKVDVAGSAAFAYGASRIVRTTNRGRTWTSVRRPKGSRGILQLDMISARVGYLLDRNAELFATTNAGRKWRRIETTGANTAGSIAFGDRKHGYIGDPSGRILATSDGGATWSRQYPFYHPPDPRGDSDGGALKIAASTKSHAIALDTIKSSIFATKRGGRIGRSSKLVISPSVKRVRRGTVVPVTGRLSPATGVERVAVMARIIGAKGGTQWATQNVTVSPSGTFTTKWKVTAPTIFIARWSGDAGRDGDAAPRKIVRLRK